MNKKVIIGITVFIAIVIVGIGSYFLLKNTSKNENLQTDNKQESKIDDTTSSTDKKTLVVYYSATGSTKHVAEEIAKNLKTDLFEIVPEDVYTSEDLNWSNEKSRVSREHDDETLRDIKLKNTKVDNWESYDTVLIGYPIWWGIAAWPVNTFVKANNFNDKTVIPFCTSASSDLGQSGELLAKEANSGNWQEGQRFNSSPSNSEIKKFIDSIN